MKYKCIACDALARPVYLRAALSPHIIDVEFVERGLHDRPLVLRDRLQSIIDSSSELDYDAILLVYGLCGQATMGLRAHRIPLVIPRAHDCITLFLGSRERYQYEFENNPGTYWYVQDYIERDNGAGSALSLGPGVETTDFETEYQQYIEKYGIDNADYLMTVMGAWKKHYQRAVYIDMNIGESSKVKETARVQAQDRGWEFDEIAGDLVLIRKLIDGEWSNNAEDFLVVPDGNEVKMAYDNKVIMCGLINRQ